MIGSIRRRATMINEGSGPTPSTSLMIVGPYSIEGDTRAGQYYLLDVDNMKQVVGNQAEVIDNYKEYIGPITWSASGTGSIHSDTGTEAHVDVTSSGNIQVTARIGQATYSRTVTAVLNKTDYYVTSFADLQEIQRVINNGSESTITLSKNPESQYSPVNGDGLSGAHLRLTGDIDCNQSCVCIGTSGSATVDSTATAFRGVFDGAGYKIFNTGGSVQFTALTGQKYAVILFGHTSGAKIFNFTLTGNITKISGTNTGYFGILWNTNLSRIHTSVYYDRVTNAGATLHAAPICICKYNNITDLLLTDDIYGPQCAELSDWPSFTNFKRLIDLSTVNNITPSNYTSLGIARPGEQDVFEDTMIINSITSKSSSKKVSSAGFTLATANSVTITRFYCLRTYVDCDKLASWYIRKGSYSPTLNNCYYDSTRNLFAIQSDEGATARTTSQFKSGNLFSNPNWIEKEGFYPLINNQFAVNTSVLQAIR